MLKYCLCAILTAWAFSASVSAAPKHPDTFTYLTISDSDSLDPAWSYDVSSHAIILNVYEPLFTYDHGSTEKILPLLAEKVPTRENGLISADGRTYTIALRAGVKFHDGSPMTPEDARYSIIRFMLADRAGGPSSLLLEPLVGYSATRDDKGTINPKVWEDANRAVSVQGTNLILRLPRPYAPLLSILAMWAPVVSKTWAAKNGDWDGTEATWTRLNNFRKESSPFFERANGTGPFKLERWDRKTKEFILTRNDNYWRSPARLKNIVVKGVNEFGTRKLMLEAGDADAIYADRPLLTQVKNLPGVKIIDDLPTLEMNPMVFFTYHINTVGNAFVGSGALDGNGIPPDFFSDKDVRKAFAYSFDYRGYINDVMRGKGTQARGAIPKALLGYAPNQPVYSLDSKKAAEHLKTAWGGKVWEKGFSFTLAFNAGNLQRQTVSQILKRNVEALNPKFKIDVRGVEWPTFLDAQKDSKLPIFIMGWNADFPDPHNFAFPILHSLGQFPKYQKFSNPEMDRLVEQANQTTDIAQRKRLYEQLQALEYEEVPCLVLIDMVVYRTQRDWVKGWYWDPIFPDGPYSSYYYPLTKE